MRSRSDAPDATPLHERIGCALTLFVLFRLYGGVDSTSPSGSVVSHRLYLVVAATQ